MTQAFDRDSPPSLAVADILHPSCLPVMAPGYNAHMRMLGAACIDPSRDNLLASLHAQQSMVRSYLSNWAQQSAPWNDVCGTAHGFDFLFVFGNVGPSLLAKAANSTANQPGRVALSAVMMDRVRAFVHTGNPNHAGLGPEWQPWPCKLIFDADQNATRLSVQ